MAERMPHRESSRRALLVGLAALATTLGFEAEAGRNIQLKIPPDITRHRKGAGDSMLRRPRRRPKRPPPTMTAKPPKP